MKKLFFITGILFSFTLTACGGSNGSEMTNIDEITCTPDSISIDGTGGSASVTVNATHEWGTIISDSWIKMDKTSAGSGQNTASVSADVNPTTQVRNGTITLMAGAARKIIKVIQKESKTNLDPKGPDGYKLVWHDEFNTGTVLSSDWTHEVQSSGWVNNELQNYVDGNIDGNRVTEIKDGKLQIHCFKYNGKIYSGRVYANVGTGWKYGYFEANIKLPKGKGTWPAFWMMPANNNYSTNPWPGCGELDIMEEVGYNPNVIYSTIHCTKYNNGGSAIESGNKKIDTAESDFHLYAMKWTSSEIIFYVDGETILTYKNDGTGVSAWPFNNPFYVILNLAYGGNWGGAQGVDYSALPLTMEVDYVRVFQQQ